MKNIPKKKVILYIIGILILLFLGKIYTSTGFLKQNDLDKKDSEVWEFKDEIIVGAEREISSNPSIP